MVIQRLVAADKGQLLANINAFFSAFDLSRLSRNLTMQNREDKFICLVKCLADTLKLDLGVLRKNWLAQV